MLGISYLLSVSEFSPYKDTLILLSALSTKAALWNGKKPSFLCLYSDEHNGVLIQDACTLQKHTKSMTAIHMQIIYKRDARHT